MPYGLYACSEKRFVKMPLADAYAAPAASAAVMVAGTKGGGGALSMLTLFGLALLIKEKSKR
jgi:hypothetical protein